MSSEKPELKPLDMAMLGFGFAQAAEGTDGQQEWFSYDDFTAAIGQSPFFDPELRDSSGQLNDIAQPLIRANYLEKTEGDNTPLLRTTEKTLLMVPRAIARHAIDNNIILPHFLTEGTIKTLRSKGKIASRLVEAAYNKKADCTANAVIADLAVLGFAHAKAHEDNPWFKADDLSNAPQDSMLPPLYYATAYRSVQKLSDKGLLLTNDERAYFINYKAAATTQQELYANLTQKIQKGARNLAQLLILPHTIDYIRHDTAFAEALLETMSTAPLSDQRNRVMFAGYTAAPKKLEFTPLTVAVLGFAYRCTVDKLDEPWFSYREFNEAIKQSPLCDRNLAPAQLSRATTALRKAKYLDEAKEAPEYPKTVHFQTTERTKSALYKNIANYVLQKGMLLPRLLLLPETIDVLRADDEFASYLVNEAHCKETVPLQPIVPDMAVLGFAYRRTQSLDSWFRNADIYNASQDAQLRINDVSVMLSTSRLADEGVLKKRINDTLHQAEFRATHTARETFFRKLSQELLKGTRNLAQLLVLPETVERIRHDEVFARHFLDYISTDTSTTTSNLGGA